DWMPFQLKRLRRYLADRGVGRVTVKKRGFPLTPEELIARLRLKGDESRVLVMTRHNGKPVAIVCEEAVWVK
ncbi:MAG: SAM-dependent methyltransferase, partial [Chloroflexi bacterium]|nr:SAM-dependent methyltransferase [Chloroflexota bacterium]